MKAYKFAIVCYNSFIIFPYRSVIWSLEFIKTTNKFEQNGVGDEGSYMLIWQMSAVLDTFQAAYKNKLLPYSWKAAFDRSLKGPQRCPVDHTQNLHLQNHSVF